MNNIKTWRDFINCEAQKEYFKALWKNVENARQKTVVFPEKKDIFVCFDKCPLEKVKIVIIGQDPYHGDNQAHGMSFSVKDGVKVPPSLRNIYKELNSDLGCKIPSTGNLEKWASQGVLLMNTSFSVEKGKPASHSKIGWMQFSEHVLDFLNKSEKPIVFILWGAHAQKIGERITNPIHLKLSSVHPSPLSANRGFFGSKPFSKANKFLEEHGEKPINWQI